MKTIALYLALCVIAYAVGCGLIALVALYLRIPVREAYPAYVGMGVGCAPFILFYSIMIWRNR